tara:strand:+ start:178 stop:729 length:552 start_codon:yes stop_codon:yes gene_type:complete
MILKLIKFDCVKSTNDEAIRIVRSKKNSQGIVVSNFQTKGRGTMGKKWISYKGNFFASIFFELKKSMPNFKEFSLINPVIIKKILNEYSSHQVKIKWPNDLLIKNRKVCGILQELIKVEKKFFLIVGIGINTVRSPKRISFKGISLMESSNRLVDNSEILQNLKKNYETIFYNYKFNKKLLKK